MSNRAVTQNFVLFTPILQFIAASDVAVTDVVQPLVKCCAVPVC
jgi:hypothetical protein